MPWNYITRSLVFTSLYFAIMMPVINGILDLFIDITGGFLFWVFVGALVGLIFGTMQLVQHFKNIKELTDEVNEETVKPIRTFEILLDEKMDHSISILTERLKDKDWKVRQVDRQNGYLELSVMKYSSSIMPYKFEINLLPRNDGKTYLSAEIKPPIFDNFLPDLGKSLAYTKEFKTALL